MLLIDAGNSRIKSALWREGRIEFVESVETGSSHPPAAWHSLGSPERILASSVAGPAVETRITEWTKSAWSLIPEFAKVRRTAAGMNTRYEDPARLGVDRWLAALAAYHLAGGAAVVVDAGTALTIDVIDAGGTHLGGSISPGLSLMAKSLTHNTAHLRLHSLIASDDVATNTAVAISTGCRDAVAGGIERMRDKIRRSLVGDMHWYITGGEAQIVMTASSIDFQHVPDLVMRGLVLANGTVP
jgi:type III pantothenate kinase